MDGIRNLGIIVDMQCGGWSTTLLTSEGTLHTVGVIDGTQTFTGQENLEALAFPEQYTSSLAGSQVKSERIAIRHFSAGRTHILAPSDDRTIWSWYHAQQPALRIKIADVHVKELSFGNRRDVFIYGQVKRLAAGWSRSSALIQGFGIVFWDPVRRDNADDDVGTAMISKYGLVPKTGYQRIRGHQDSSERKTLSEEVGSVKNYIMLEHYVVFVTDISRVFCGKLDTDNEIDSICELRQLRSTKQLPRDIQGSFRRFAIFKGDEVITAHQDYLDSCWNVRDTDLEQAGISGLRKIPALQHNGVISIAFGDYHFLALHSNGTITSYGTEMDRCGSLGLGELATFNSIARGITGLGLRSQHRLSSYAYMSGRQIWFDCRKKKWLNYVLLGGKDQEECEERRDMYCSDVNVRAEMSEWFEQEGQAWEEDTGEDGLGTYFALRVSAAGRHSGALVLVNEELAEKPATYNWEEKCFPRLILSDGTEMPGRGDFDVWRKQKPDWRLDEEAWSESFFRAV